MGFNTKIGVVSDSMCDLPSRISEKFRIAVVPGIVYVDGVPHQSGVDIHPKDIQAIIDDEEKTIKTGAPPPAAYYRAYESLYDSVDIILSLHCPIKHSGVLNSAKAGARHLRDSSRVVHFECGVATIGLGITAIAAAIKSQQIENKEDLIRIVQEYCTRIQIIGTLESFKYLQRSGRFGLKVAGWIANTLSVKPVLLMRDSNVFLIKKPRNRNSALNQLISYLSKTIDREINPRIVGISHFGCEEELNEVEKKIKGILPDHMIIRGFADPMVAANAGPGLVLIAYFADSIDNSNKGIKINV
ncbi:MAG: DegV family protein [Promethearchaeota archaeon]